MTSWLGTVLFQIQPGPKTTIEEFTERLLGELPDGATLEFQPRPAGWWTVVVTLSAASQDTALSVVTNAAINAGPAPEPIFDYFASV